MYYHFQVSQDFLHGAPVCIIQPSRLLWHEVHLQNPPYCLRTSDVDMTQHWLNLYQSVAYGTMAHYWVPPNSTWYVYTWISHAPQSVSRARHVGPSFRPTIFCLACVGLLKKLQKDSSLSVALWHTVHDWDPPSAAWFGWNYWTSALLLK